MGRKMAVTSYVRTCGDPHLERPYGLTARESNAEEDGGNPLWRRKGKTGNGVLG